MTKLLRLSHKHKKRRAFSHPLLINVQVFTDDQLTEIASRLPDSRDELIMSLLFCVKGAVMRYLGAYKIAENHLDDMVSEGLAAICKFVDDFPEFSLDSVEGCAIVKVAYSRIKYAIDTYLSQTQSIVTPSEHTQRNRVAKGKPPFNTSIPMQEVFEPAADCDISKRDTLEVLNRIEARDKIDAYILCPDYWGWTGQELADLLGVERWEISRRRKQLYQQYKELSR